VKISLDLASSSSRKMMLLAPSGSAAYRFFEQTRIDPVRYRHLLADLQSLRGRVYLQDGAIQPQHLIGRKHQLHGDEKCWHLLVLDEEDRVSGCIRCQEYPDDIEFSQLGVSNAELANCNQWGATFRNAVEAELSLSRRLGRSYAEVGGWALSERIRGTVEALRLVLASYALAEKLGGWVVLSTATHRNGSASILKRIGGRPLEYQNSQLPSYHDPKYGCEMEILRFYSWAPSPRFGRWVSELKTQLRKIPVLAGATPMPAFLPGSGFQAKAAAAGAR